jgi:hypothetical protein
MAGKPSLLDSHPHRGRKSGVKPPHSKARFGRENTSTLQRFNASTKSCERHELPTDFSVRYFKPRNAWRRTAVGPGHAARVEKQNTTASFVARDVRVPVQKNIDIIGRSIRRNVLQAQFQPTAHKVENQWPLEIAVAISAHNDHSRSNRTQFVENRFSANIAKMPDLISVLRHLCHALRQTIVRVRENKHTPSFFGFWVRSHVEL